MRPSRSKAGIQLAVNVLVVIIIGIVLLGLGVTLVVKLVSQGEDYSKQVDERLKEQLRRTQFSDGRLAAVLNPHEVVSSGDGEFFLLGFVNKLDSQHEFKVEVEYQDSSESLNSQQTSLARDEAVIYDSSEVLELAPNEEAFRWVKVVLSKDLPSGEYLYDVYVCYNGTNTNWDEGVVCPTDYRMYGGRKHRLFLTFEG